MKVSVLGATGYAGAELLRILYNHPQAKVVHITSESHTGEKIADLYPHLRGCYDMVLESMKDIEPSARTATSSLSGCRTATR